MSVKWTNDQQHAIDARGKGIIVSAAAGSGKTAVLIERIIRLLCDEKNKIPADRLLAVTFTNDAAAQMRDKLNEAMEKKLAENPSDSWILQQQNLVQLARISTIDSFCFDLVKDNLPKFEFQGGVRILEEADKDMILSNALDQALEELCANSRQEYELLDNAFDFDDKHSNTVSRAVDQLYKYLRTISFRDKWIERSMTLYEDDEFFEVLKDNMFSQSAKKLESLKKDVDFVEYCYNYYITEDVYDDEDDSEPEEQTYYLRDYIKSLGAALSAVQDMYGSLEESLRNKNWEKTALFELEKTKNLTFSGADDYIKSIFDDIKKQLSERVSKIKKELSCIAEPYKISQGHYRDNLRKSNEIFAVLCKLEKRVEEIAYEAKLEKNALDFGDVELMARDLLVKETENGFERTELAEEIRSSGMYKIIMIDEYQDVNDLQEIIFKSISDTDSLDIMGKNTFIVGDVKQAIYRFRLTNPKLFIRCISQAKDSSNAENLEHIGLRKNFRSRREVLDLSNFIFSNIMTAGCGEVDYTEEESLEPGADYYTKRSCPAEIMLIDQSEDYDAAKIGYSQEFLETAKRIRQLIDRKAPVCDGGVDRPCRPSDFCVLVTKNKHIKQLAKALETVGLKALSEDTEGYIKSREISIAVDMLRVIDNPMNDIALTAVMMSPIMSFTPDEMAIVRMKCRIPNSHQMKHIYQIIGEASKDKDPDKRYGDFIDMGSELLQNKCTEAYNMIESLRYDSMSISLEGLVRRIFDVTDLMAITSLYLDSDKKRANLRLLLEYASSYEQNGKDGITGFLRYIDSVSGNDKAFRNAVTVTAGYDSVNVKTYHKSKGLEYPYVFLCCLGFKTLQERQMDLKLKTHNRFGYCFEFKDKRLNVKRRNLYYDFLTKVCDDELKSEKMRLFYVGCTRAKEKLVFVCAFNKGISTYEKCMENLRTSIKSISGYEKIPAEIIAEQETVLNWTLMALAKHPNREPLEQWLGMSLDSIPIDRSGENVDIQYIRCGSSDEMEDEVITEDTGVEYPSANAEKVIELRKKYSFKYDTEQSHLPAKLSVTEIVAEEKEKMLGEKNPEFFPNLPRLNDELDKLTAAEKGTFTHKFMEAANYDRAYVSVKDELNRLVKEGFFTPKEASGVYVSKLESFVKTDFFARMRASKDLRREQKFLAAVKDLALPEELKGITGGEGMIQGIADCIFKEDDGWVLIDFKTDNFQSKEDMNKYGTQLALYKAAFELIYGERVKSSYIYSFKLGEGAEFQF